MTRRWVALAIAAAVAWPAVAAPVPPQQITARQPVTLDAGGALAAFAVDASMVDVAIQGGRVVLLGRRAGETVVTVVLASGVESFRVRVEPAPLLLSSSALLQEAQGGFVETRYDSALRRFTGVLDGRGRAGEYDVRVFAEAVHQRSPAPGDTTLALPAASVEITRGSRSVVLLDQYVQESPLTLDGVVLRGVHVREGDTTFHAGLAAWSPLEGFLAADGERAATASHTFRTGGLRVTPRAAWFPDSRGGSKGMAAVTLEFGTDTDALRVRADAGFGGAPAAAVDVDYRTPQRQVWLRAQARPPEAAALRTARPPGRHADAAWTEVLDADTSVSAAASASQLELPGLPDVRSASARAELRRQLGEHWSATAFASGGAYRAGDAEPLRRGTAGAGVAWDTSEWGANAQYRYQVAGGTGGHGGRVSVRASSAGWRASGFLDVQQQAPTLDLVLQDRDQVARTLASLGIAAAQPEDILRALRDNAGLIAGHNLSIGPVRLNPLRAQAGIDLSWRGDGPAKPLLGLRLLRDRVDGVVGARSSLLATLHASWRIGERTELGVAATRWSTGRQGQDKAGDTGVQVTLRTYFDRPLIAPGAGEPIAGQVLRERDDGTREPLADVEVVLDRNRRTRTDAQGRYAFERAGAGSHSVEAVLPKDESAYFTTPSVLARDAGGKADFAIAFSGVRLSGVVLNDAGLPVAGVTVQAEGIPGASAVSDTSGAYRLTVPAGEVRVVVVAETLPAGHDLRALAARTRTVAKGEPATVNFSVRALRSIEGVAPGRPGQLVTAVEAGRSATTDAEGRFVLRRLPAGPLTLVVGEAANTTQVVEMPSGPGVVRVKIEGR